MVRTFIAIEIPPRIRETLLKEITIFRAHSPLVKWVHPDNLHLTLRFLGDVKENDLDELFSALEEETASLSSFDLEVKGTGAFPNWRYPRVVWAGCGDGSDEVVTLAEAVEGVCVDLGYEHERRPFRPHLTLGRIKHPADAPGLEEAVRPVCDKTFGYLDVEDIVVFMSSLRRTGPVYSPMARFPLG